MSVNKRRWLRGKQIYKLTSQPHLFEIGTSIDNKLQICQSLILDGAGQVVLVRWNLQGPQRRPLCRLNFQFHHFLIVSHRCNKIWEGGEENSMSTRLHRKSHCSSWIWPWRGDKIKKVLFNEKFPGRYRIWFGGKKQGCGYVSKSQDHLLSENFSRRKEMWFCGEVGDHLLTNL